LKLNQTFFFEFRDFWRTKLDGVEGGVSSAVGFSLVGKVSRSFVGRPGARRLKAGALSGRTERLLLRQSLRRRYDLAETQLSMHCHHENKGSTTSPYLLPQWLTGVFETVSRHNPQGRIHRGKVNLICETPQSHLIISLQSFSCNLQFHKLFGEK
jgi:hypothetical protein